MKNGVLICAPSGSRKNIGDYIQSVAQEQYFSSVDCFVDREHLSSFESNDEEKIRLIMNGWFMWHPECFLPGPSIVPLFISFHVVPAIADNLLTPEVIRYLKRYEPIGARDTGTQELLTRRGINSYFSGCLTTTLDLKYAYNGKRKGVCFVDPFYSVAGTRSTLFDLKGYFKGLFLLIKNYRKVSFFIHSFHHEYWTWYGRISRKLEKRICASVFYENYSKLCDDELIFNAQYITHNVPSSSFQETEEWMDYAKELIRTYAHARFVITSRIHCALPCLGVETPCIFVSSDVLSGNSLRSSGRFGGLLEMMNVIRFSSKGFSPLSKGMSQLLGSGLLTMESKFSNPTVYQTFRDAMKHRVRDFLTN